MVFHPLFGSRTDSPLARPFRKYQGSVDDELIRFPANWDQRLAEIPGDEELAALSNEAMVERYSLHPDFFTMHVPSALRRWRQSPSQSAIAVLGSIDSTPSAGRAIFADLLTQARAIAAFLVIEALHPNFIRSIAKDGKYVRLADSIAATLDDEGRDAFFAPLFSFHLWERRNRAKARLGFVKLPKTLFRGVRDKDMRLPVSSAEVEGEPWNFRFCRIHLQRRRQLLNHPLATVAGTTVLSFTATRTVAEYFTSDEGSVVELKDADFDVISSWSLDAALSDADPVTGRQEREWIIRVRPDFTLASTAVTSRDRTLAYSTRDPLGIEILHHHNHARYELEGKRVQASFHYNANGYGGRVYYTVDDGYPEPRRTIKAKTGFDPMPGPGRPASGLIYFSREPWQTKRKNIEYFEIAGAE